jgi:hypothetical protein
MIRSFLSPHRHAGVPNGAQWHKTARYGTELKQYTYTTRHSRGIALVRDAQSHETGGIMYSL